jgi:hypothetical protein
MAMIVSYFASVHSIEEVAFKMCNKFWYLLISDEDVCVICPWLIGFELPSAAETAEKASKNILAVNPWVRRITEEVGR